MVLNAQKWVRSAPRAVAAEESIDPRSELVQRVASSNTFEKSYRLRTFLDYVCQCALDNRPEAATEQQIGIHVFGRPFGYNPNEDNIVRSQARLLRLKLEHHFAHEGLDEALIITIPKGQYLPVFTPRAAVPVPLPAGDVMRTVRPSHLLMTMTALAAIFATATILLTYFLLRSKPLAPAAATVRIPPFYLPPQTAHTTVGTAQPFAALAPDDGAIRIAAGTATDYVDARGHRWNSDRYFEGGLARPAPTDLFPPASDGGPFRSIREGVSTNAEASPAARNFRYVIPDPPGVYELRLYFADPNRRSAPDTSEDAQNLRHFSVNLNGVPILRGLDVVADASPAPVDVRAFKDVSPAKDGKVHLEFIGDPEPPFLSALELTPGTPHKLRPIRISVRPTDFVDANGTHWSGDSFFVGGRRNVWTTVDSGPAIPPAYTAERYGTFNYAIPVPAGSYILRLHFLESFFSPWLSSGHCQGAGCRVFDVTCNGVSLLNSFDIVAAAPGAFRPVVRTFHHLQPNAQGKLALSFMSRVNYAEIRAIEVLDEAR